MDPSSLDDAFMHNTLGLNKFSIFGMSLMGDVSDLGILLLPELHFLVKYVYCTMVYSRVIGERLGE